MKYLLYAVTTLFVAQVCFAQTATINGVLVNKETRKPIEYASVALLHIKDSSVIAGDLSKKNGSFSIQNIVHGKYLLKIVSLGYSSFIQEITLTADKTIVNIDSLFIYPSGKQLVDVQVTGKRTNISNKADKQTYRADQFQTAAGATAIEILRNLPSVSVNGSGEISVRGSSGFLVLVNGKPVMTDAATILGQLPANTIERIDLITAPSAKYDADGTAGIIDIITKKGTTDGLAIAANIQGGLPSTTTYHNLEKPQRFGGDVTLNLRKNKWDVSISANYLRNDVNGKREGDVYTKNVAANTITRFPSIGERSFDKYNYGLRTAIAFTADQNNIFNLGLFASKKYQLRRADLLYNVSVADLTSNAVLRQSPYFNSNLQRKEGNFSLANIDYTHIFKNKSTLTGSVLLEHANLFGNTRNLNLNYPGKDQVIQEVNNPYENPLNGYRAKIDYALPIGNNKLEAGYQFRHDNQDGYFDYTVTPATGQTDLARFKGTARSVNQIHSVYTQYSGRKDQMQYQAGLRYEYATREVILSSDILPHNLQLQNLFPSVNLLYTLTNNWLLKTGYSKRVQRNNNFELNPIPEREHSETLEQGDPDLLPQFVDLAELGITHNFSKGSFFSTLYYQQIKNPVQRVNSVYADTILNRLFTNAEKATVWGLEFGGSLKPAKWCSFYLGANIYQYRLSGNLNILGVNAVTANHSWVYSINSNTSFDLGKNWALQASVNYLSNRPTAQGEDSRFLTPNSSLKKTFAGGRCSLDLQWQNMNLGMLNANKQRITTFGNNFYTTTNYIYETDVLLLNFSYKFNRLSGKAKLPVSEMGEKEF